MTLPDIIGFAGLPVSERVADRLADLLFDADEVLAMLGEEGASSVRWMEPAVRKVFDDVDQLIRKVSD
jgi:hypothetical protein